MFVPEDNWKLGRGCGERTAVDREWSGVLLDGGEGL